MLPKGYEFAYRANESINTSSASNPPNAAVAGDFPFDADLSDKEREKILEKDPLAFYVRPKRKPKVLIIGPAEWPTEDLVAIKDQLASRDINATTFRAENLPVDQVLESISNCDCVVLVTGAEAASWGKNNRLRITATADRLEKRWRVLEDTTWSGAADAASKLL
jgi:hypothetical protein